MNWEIINPIYIRIKEVNNISDQFILRFKSSEIVETKCESLKDVNSRKASNGKYDIYDNSRLAATNNGNVTFGTVYNSKTSNRLI